MNPLPFDTNLIDPSLIQNQQGPPVELFADWRRRDPVHWNPAPTAYRNPNALYKIEKGFWVLTKYEHIAHVSRNPTVFSSWLGGPTVFDFAPADLARQRAGIMGMDPPLHAQAKKLVSPPFSPKNLRAFEPEIRAVAKEIVDRVAAAGNCEFVFDVASRLPVYTFCVLMGIPEADRERIFKLGNTLADSENNQSVQTIYTEFADYARQLADEKRAKPDGSMMSGYVNGEVDGERMSPAQIAMFFTTVAVAGHETTRNTAVHFIRLMYEYPEQYALLRTDLDRYLLGAIDEVLRFAPPVVDFRRTAAQDVMLGGVEIKQGDKIYLAYAAANRDPEVFEDPDRFDITRANARRHLSFGTGEHVCLGAQLAGLQLQLLLRQVITRLPDIRPEGKLEWINSIQFNGVRRMSVSYSPETSVAAGAA